MMLLHKYAGLVVVVVNWRTFIEAESTTNRHQPRVQVVYRPCVTLISITIRYNIETKLDKWIIQHYIGVYVWLCLSIQRISHTFPPRYRNDIFHHQMALFCGIFSKCILRIFWRNNISLLSEYRRHLSFQVNFHGNYLMFSLLRGGKVHLLCKHIFGLLESPRNVDAKEQTEICCGLWYMNDFLCNSGTSTPSILRFSFPPSFSISLSSVYFFYFLAHDIFHFCCWCVHAYALHAFFEESLVLNVIRIRYIRKYRALWRGQTSCFHRD